MRAASEGGMVVPLCCVHSSVIDRWVSSSTISCSRVALSFSINSGVFNHFCANSDQTQPDLLGGSGIELGGDFSLISETANGIIGAPIVTGTFSAFDPMKLKN